MVRRSRYSYYTPSPLLLSWLRFSSCRTCMMMRDIHRDPTLTVDIAMSLGPLAPALLVIARAVSDEWLPREPQEQAWLHSSGVALGVGEGMAMRTLKRHTFRKNTQMKEPSVKAGAINCSNLGPWAVVPSSLRNSSTGEETEIMMPNLAGIDPPITEVTA